MLKPRGSRFHHIATRRTSLVRGLQNSYDASNPDERVDRQRPSPRGFDIAGSKGYLSVFLFASRVRLTEHSIAKLTWSVSHVDGGGIFPLVSHRVGNVGEREFALVELVEAGQLIELVPGLLLEKVFVVEVRSGQNTRADRRWIMRSVSLRVRHHRHGVWK